MIRLALHGSVILLLTGIGAGSMTLQEPPNVEICDNAVDDDGDGRIDLHDPDCACTQGSAGTYLHNPSFEDLTCCPASGGELQCADQWIQASARTTDFLHRCDWQGWAEFPPPEPFPDGDGIVGFRNGRVLESGPEWNCKEYAGTCLNKALIQNTEYQLEFYIGFVDRDISPTIDISLFGTANCQNLPFGDGNQDIGCPTNAEGWIELGSVNVGGVGWLRTQINFTPPDAIRAIAIGPACPEVQSQISIYYFLDDLSIEERTSQPLQITAAGDPCADFNLGVPSDPSFDYQWYRDGIAIVGQTLPVYLPDGIPGYYQVMLTDDNGCYLTPGYTFFGRVVKDSMSAVICAGQTFAFGTEALSSPGVYHDTIPLSGMCDSIATLLLDVIDDAPDTMHAQLLPGDHIRLGEQTFDRQGEYLVTLTGEEGCTSKVFLIIQQLPLYIPNVFSPNGDGVNDEFAIVIPNQKAKIHQLQIMDRWGSVVYSANDIDDIGYSEATWDGTYNGVFVNSGVYVYGIVVTLENGRKKTLSGTVTVLR